MENIWHNLFAPEAKVCGCWLRHYSLWHHALLAAFKSPLLDSSPTVSAGDLLLAVDLCRTDYPHRPRLRRRTWWRLRLLLGRKLLTRHAETLGAWLAAHLSGPVFWDDPRRKGTTLTAPEVYSLVYGLTSKCGLTQTEAWNTTPGQASTILGAVAELEGAQLSFYDPDELAAEADKFSDRQTVFDQAVADLGPTAAEQFMAAWDADHPTTSNGVTHPHH